MLLTPRCVFTHLPRTGGLWVRQAIRRSGVPVYEADLHIVPGRVLPAVPDRYSFTFVRHPVTWWRSWWAQAQLCGPPAAHAPLHRIAGFEHWLSYAEYMTRVLNDLPGEYARIADRYTDGVAHVGRTEQLAGDLARFLADAGAPPHAGAARPVHAGIYDPQAAASTPQIDEGIRQAEAAVIAGFYPEELPARVVSS